MKSIPKVGLSLMPENEFIEAAGPLFHSGEVEILEWSFDMGWGQKPLPDFCTSILDQYSSAKSLVGHGVSFSVLSGEWTPRQQCWLDSLKKEVSIRNYQHITEHFGFMTAGNFHFGPSLPVPLTPDTLALGRYRIKQIADACGLDVGLENLALAFGPSDVLNQGRFIDEMVDAVNGFLLLDLHNIYCQLCNFQMDARDLLKLYPLHKVREIHVSGGSWSHPPSLKEGAVRRDTHDEAVPDEVFDLVNIALEYCPNIEVVIFERLGYTLSGHEEIAQYRNDFLTLKQIVKEHFKNHLKEPCFVQS